MKILDVKCINFIFAVLFNSLTLINGSIITYLEGVGAALLGDMSTANEFWDCPSNDNFVRFDLYTNSHPQKPLIFQMDNQELISDMYKFGFNKSLPTVIIIHGYLESKLLSHSTKEMANIFLEMGNYNVITVDWSCGSVFNYYKALEYVKKISSYTYGLLNVLMIENMLKPEDIYIVGFSLGAHIAGIVGQKMKIKGTVSRITGLDPAGPVFLDVDLVYKLDSSDAAFVDVIHTNMGEYLLDGVGIPQSSGNIDFYVNGGASQPGCNESLIGIGTIYNLICNHLRSKSIFAESLIHKREKNSGKCVCQFIGVKCDNYKNFTEGKCLDCSNDNNCAIIGYQTNSTLKDENKFYLKTAEKFPYCLFQYGVVLEIQNGGQNSSQQMDKTNIGSLHINLYSDNDTIVDLEVTLRKETKLNDLAATYLATSKQVINMKIERATAWIENNSKKNRLLKKKNIPLNKTSLKIKKITIIPITLHDKEDYCSVYMKKNIELCFANEQPVKGSKKAILNFKTC